VEAPTEEQARATAHRLAQAVLRAAAPSESRRRNQVSGPAPSDN